MLNIQNTLHKILSINKKCIMQWVLAHAGIDDNKNTDALTKKARKLNNDKFPRVVTLNEVNTVAKSRLKDKPMKLKHQICELDTSRTWRTLLPGSKHTTLEGWKSTEMVLQSTCTGWSVTQIQNYHLNISSSVRSFWPSSFYNRLETVTRSLLGHLPWCS